MTSPDPITLAVVQNRLDHLTQHMGWVMVRTARSPIFSQSHDFSCFLAGPDGTVVAQADGIPIHTGSAGFAVRAIIRDFGSDMHQGDVFLLNDPYLAGGNHLPDWVIGKPAYFGDTLIGFACNRAHQADIGGGASGTYNSNATEIFHEGIRLPVLRLVERGRVRDDLWRLLLANTRAPEALDGDLRAMIGSARIGAEGLVATAREYGLEAMQIILEALLAHADRRQRQAMARLPAGIYLGEDRSDNDCFELRDVWVRVRLTVNNDGTAIVDFTGSSPQIKGFKNSSLANTHSAVFVALTAFLDPDIPRNGGRFRSLQVVAPEGSVVNPRPPAPMTMCTTFVAHEIIHALWQALSKADPERACAGWGKNIFGVTSGSGKNGAFVLYHVNAACGAGAVDGRDGFNSIGHVASLGGFIMPNIEAAERQFPVRYSRQEFRLDNAGAGKFRGGTGVEYEVEVEAPAQHAFRGEGLRYISSFGVNGGDAGGPGEMLIETPDRPFAAAPKFGLLTCDHLRIRASSPGGGGFGHPMQRDPAAVLRDVRDGVVSARAAFELYGVVLVDGETEVNSAATAARRVLAMQLQAQQSH
jgi:N-methylhydantoinase B